ncbi:MAG TPA: hypothetical protein PLV72_03635 [Candidatus Magasanikbacteria bacterium]|nr:hypothetical protein [Candidatus Magasanikbacteria bacterium]
MKNEMIEIEKDLELIKNVYLKLLTILPSFNITDSKILPYGLKAHTRSVSWLVEQVITQQTKYNAKKLGVGEVNFDFPDTSLHDCEIVINGKSYFINIKIHNTEGRENKNDISAVEKLYFQYSVNKKYTLIYACFGIQFEKLKIIFNKNYLEVFSPQFLPIYINPRNDKIQATYRHDKIYRTRDKFLRTLKEKSKSIILK